MAVCGWHPVRGITALPGYWLPGTADERALSPVCLLFTLFDLDDFDPVVHAAMGAHVMGQFE